MTKTMTQKTTGKTAAKKAATPSEAPAAAPPMPKAGGSYRRNEDGSLTRVAHTKEASPRGKADKEA